jgi:hypothetical protein
MDDTSRFFWLIETDPANAIVHWASFRDAGGTESAKEHARRIAETLPSGHRLTLATDKDIVHSYSAHRATPNPGGTP